MNNNVRTIPVETPSSENHATLSAGFVGMLLLISCFYNAGLAMINAHAFAMTPAVVILTEIIIACLGTLLVVRHFPVIPKMGTAYLLVIVSAISIPIVTIYNGDLYLKSIRDVYLIALFFILGNYMNTDTLKVYFRALCALIFAFMLVEMLATDLYVSLFEPSSYFANTRGIEEFEYDDSGLFRNALGYEGRFSYGIFDTHRLSSLFLEQVTLGNFAIVIALFLATFWKDLGRWDRLFYICSIVFITLTTGSRAASFLVAMIAIGYFVFPLLPRYINVLYMPLMLIGAFAIFYDPSMPFQDTFAGRIRHTANMISEMDMGAFFAGNLAYISKTADSGYTYLFYTQGILGLIALWLFVSFCVIQKTAQSKRFSNALSLYIFANLLIGSGIFSIKVSAPLWIMAGVLYAKQKEKEHLEGDQAQA